MNNKLAIVIPAYKTTYLQETLESLSNQTCKDFKVYIGNDASPNDILGIVKLYEEKIDIFYKHFDENLGGIDLIAHWNRCISLSKDEEWLWLFSDDDIMEPNCVELFYKHIGFDKKSELLHFNADIIDAKGKSYAKGKAFPAKLTSADFFERRLKGELFSFVVEYIFTRKLYLENNKFQVFDLAWCADDATWVKFAKNTDITTIASDTHVHWRYSGENISSLNVDTSILFRKLNAKVSYFTWACNFFKMENQPLKINRISKVKWILSDLNQFSCLKVVKRIKIGYTYSKTMGNCVNGFLGVLYVLFYELRHVNKPRL